MAFGVTTLLITIALLTPVQDAAPEPVPPRPAAGPTQRTGKEALSDKASDEQRVDDCKVKAERRSRQRPTHCPWEVGS